jgi:hypothetical protein
MTRTPAPPSPVHPDRFLRCQEALDGAFATAAAAAVKAGWHPEEVAAAMVEIACCLYLPTAVSSAILRTSRKGDGKGHVR